MKKTQNKITVTVAEFAAASNLTTRRIRQLSEEGKLVPIRKGKIELLPAFTALCSFYQRVPEELVVERLATATATREIRQHELANLKGKFVLREEAYQKCLAALTKLKFFVRDEIEKRAVTDRREKLKALGVSEEIASQFYVWDTSQQIALIDAIEVRCEQEGKSENGIFI